MDARAALDRATTAYLVGRNGPATLDFERARAELASTARPDLVARAELLRCALQVASLVLEPCTGFERLAADASPEDRAYARYLAGRAEAADAALLPPHHREALQRNAPPPAITGDPLAALVAAGAAVRRGAAPADWAPMAVELASAQGWRRPLLAWLGVQRRAAEARGDAALAAQLGRRIDLLAPPAAAPPSAAASSP
jgi:hypothetical protein